ncbi:MAG TPA: TIGR04438 family Trp-rich protein [Burkholderiaceae bacterium]|nr:TIGR04438 family Trp-rich protein [Burkholderiaceae bacterium]
MLFVVIGALLTVLKALDFGPLSGIDWPWVLLPYVLALLWWWWSDASGRTKRVQMEKMEAKKAERRRKSLENLGMPTKGKGGRR